MNVVLVNNIGIASAASTFAVTYPRAAAEPTPAIPPNAPATVTATPDLTRAGAGDEAGDADDQAQLQAQKQAQLNQAEAELLRVTQAELRELASRDREVRAHEQAHLAVGGQYAGAVSYSYERGPDGRLYAVGGTVAIDTAAVPGDPAATLDKLQQVQRAALAPAQPSAQDLAIAAQAAQGIAQARAELASQALTLRAEGPGQGEPPDAAGTGGSEADKGVALYRQISQSDEPLTALLQAQA